MNISLKLVRVEPKEDFSNITIGMVYDTPEGVTIIENQEQIKKDIGKRTIYMPLITTNVEFIGIGDTVVTKKGKVFKILNKEQIHDNKQHKVLAGHPQRPIHKEELMLFLKFIQ